MYKRYKGRLPQRTNNRRTMDYLDKQVWMTAAALEALNWIVRQRRYDAEKQAVSWALHMCRVYITEHGIADVFITKRPDPRAGHITRKHFFLSDVDIDNLCFLKEHFRGASDRETIICALIAYRSYWSVDKQEHSEE